VLVGANLCVPQLGVKVRYASGACTIIRGDGMDHLVQDYSGPRFFVIGTNHEACKKHALRKLGRLPPLPPRVYTPRSAKKAADQQKQQGPGEEEEMTCPCINFGADEDDEGDRVWTNEILHGAAVLPFQGLLGSSSSSGSSI
jgi:hypothetical protein